MNNKKRFRVIAIITIILASSIFASSSSIFSNSSIRNVDIAKLVALGMCLGVMLVSIVSIISNKDS